MVAHTVSQMFRLDMTSLSTYLIFAKDLGQADVDI